MKKIIMILMAMFLMLSPVANAGYQMVYNPLISQNLDYVTDGNFSGNTSFESIDVAGGYSNGGFSVYDTGDMWTKGDIYLDNGTVFLIANPVINGSFTPFIDSMFNLGSSSYRWANIWGDSVNGREIYAGVGSGSSNFVKYGAPNIETNGYGDVLTIDVNNDGTGVLTLGESGDGDSVVVEGDLRIANDNWLQWWNNATTSNINVVKVNEDNEAILGTKLITAGTDFAEDSGAAVLIDMPVSSSATAGDEMSYSFRLDGEVIMKVYSQADGLGGITNTSIVFGNDAQIIMNSTCIGLKSPLGTATVQACD